MDQTSGWSIAAELAINAAAVAAAATAGQCLRMYPCVGYPWVHPTDVAVQAASLLSLMKRVQLTELLLLLPHAQLHVMLWRASSSSIMSSIVHVAVKHC